MRRMNCGSNHPPASYRTVRDVDAKLVFAGVLLCFHLSGHLSAAQAPLPADPMVGVWELNLARSKYAIPAPKSTTVTITPATRGYTFTVDAIGADGLAQKWGYSSAFDGQESPVGGHLMIDSVMATTGGTGATVKYKKNGNVITTTTSVVSDNGRSLTVTIKIPDGKGNEIASIAVYERQ